MDPAHETWPMSEAEPPERGSAFDAPAPAELEGGQTIDDARSVVGEPAGATVTDRLGRPDAEYYSALPRKRAAAGALITDAAGAVLIVEPTYKAHWEVPGGIVEAGETARQACVRECLEELGVPIAIGRLLVVEHQTGLGERGDSVMFIYDGGELPVGRSLQLPPAELRSYRFVRADGLDELMGPRLASRLRWAVVARRTGVLVELENGVAVPAANP